MSSNVVIADIAKRAQRMTDLGFLPLYTQWMLFLVIERFRHPTAVKERFAEKGRMMPEGVHYHGSWIDPARLRCFQIMEAATPERLNKWTAEWDDLVDFEIIPVLTSQEFWTTI